MSSYWGIVNNGRMVVDADDDRTLVYETKEAALKELKEVRKEIPLAKVVEVKISLKYAQLTVN